jgi:hypothetical protein
MLLTTSEIYLLKDTLRLEERHALFASTDRLMNDGTLLLNL